MNMDKTNDELPSYTPKSTAVNQTISASAEQSSYHNSALEDKNGKKWLSMSVKSRGKNGGPLVILEGDKINGEVKLDLEKTGGIKAITISVRAGTTFVGQEEILFIDETQTLWSSASDKGKNLKGPQSWPFTFSLPTEIVVEKGTYRLPPSFSERASTAYIDYKLVVTVKKSMLQVNQTLSTSFAYGISTTAGAPSTLRKLAYQEGSPLIGPDGDSEGWKVFPPLNIVGTLFNVKPVEISCSLAVATPLCYAVGSPLPVVMTFTGPDRQALDVLASNTSVRLRLVRSMATGSDATEEKSSRRSNNHFLETLAQAYFWPSTEGNKEDHTRVLQGEIEVSRTLKPSFVFPRLAIRYKLDLLPFQAPGFTPATNDNNEVLMSVPVSIATKEAPGIRPRSHAPPGYEKPREEVDYNKSVGVLENGNQRFYHHSGGHGGFA